MAKESFVFSRWFPAISLFSFMPRAIFHFHWKKSRCMQMKFLRWKFRCSPGRLLKSARGFHGCPNSADRFRRITSSGSYREFAIA
jgi:hypothetical protein